MAEQTSLTVRIASPDDAPALLGIYAPYITNSVITFEYEIPTADEFRERILHTLERYPYLVAEKSDTIVGYAYASAFKGRAAYDWSVETSIYVQGDAHRLGIGKSLYHALESLLARQHVCNLCACIAYPHPASEAFHKSFGYRTVAHFHNSGYKSGAWCDMIWMEKELCPHTNPPLPFIPFSELPPEEKGVCL